jgi:hypothetical protein
MAGFAVDVWIFDAAIRRTGVSQEIVAKLDKTVQLVRVYQDPFEAYVEKLKEVSRRPLNDEESGLGLVRIAYEGKAILDFFVSAGKIWAESEGEGKGSTFRFCLPI